ncbi:MAG: hypothetical protein IPK59_02140 [Rhodospirillaceae bacterium]|nr:hypothetical protein [Rhodospirillaceae bacterium]
MCLEAVVAKGRHAGETLGDGNGPCIAVGETRQFSPDQFARQEAKHLCHAVGDQRDIEIRVDFPDPVRSEPHDVVEPFLRPGKFGGQLGTGIDRLDQTGKPRQLAVTVGQQDVVRVQDLIAAIESHGDVASRDTVM